MTDQNPLPDAAADRAALAGLVDRARICMLTTTTAAGTAVSRPMAVQEAELDGDLWFFTYEDSAKVTEIAAHPQVNVSFADDKHSSWTSVSGRARVVHDRAKAEELYSPALRVWFPEGLDTPGLTLLEVQAESAEIWDSPASTVRTLLGAAKAVVTKNPDAFPGENRTVQL